MVHTHKQNILFDDYEVFKEKFVHKKTTDDCYTPDSVYECVKEWVFEKYPQIKDCSIVRPFYPNGNYKEYDYSDNCIVLDNPPFSILSQIIKWYCDKGIRFFLFAPSLTVAQQGALDVCFICANARIVYENGALVNTSFVTNIETENKILLVPDLNKRIQDVQKYKAKKKKKNVTYPKNVINIAILGKLINAGIELHIKARECAFVDMVNGYKVFGGGFILNDEAAERVQKCMQEYKQKTKEDTAFEITLSPKEEYIINKLNEIKNE